MELTDKRRAIKQRAEDSLLFFVNLIAPHRVLGSVHKDLFRWWERPEAKSHQLVLLPRDHQKSAMVAYRVAWHLTKDPSLRFLYISSTANLAQKQLKFIKDILVSDVYRRYWPEMVNLDEGRRERWTVDEIAVDHPIRKEEAIRDPSIFTAGLTTSITGLHCDVAVLDDVVVYENAYTQEGRTKVKEQYSLLASIESVGAKEWGVGTRYHPKDLYNDLQEMTEDLFDPKTGEIVGKQPIYETFQRQVEDRGDGTGEFLWPRQRRSDGKWFGFDAQILSKKRGQYLDHRQFRAQYYNDPNSPGDSGIKPEYFQYYDRKYLERDGGNWFYRSRKLNICAAIDFAFSTAARADDTAIVVLGTDAERNHYVLDIDRFKTNKISEYFGRVLRLQEKWGYTKLRAEVTAAQITIVEALRDKVRENGRFLTIEEFRPSRYMGTKEERIDACLRPRYEERKIFHYLGGNIQSLEEQLVQDAPVHDDIKNALADAVDFAVAPSRRMNKRRTQDLPLIKQGFHPRFGGVV